MTESKKDNRIFKLTNFSPVGFKIFNYPVKICNICRGYLTDSCSNCIETGQDKCDVVKQESCYYHNHCHDLVNSGGNKAPQKNC